MKVVVNNTIDLYPSEKTTTAVCCVNDWLAVFELPDRGVALIFDSVEFQPYLIRKRRDGSLPGIKIFSRKH